MVRVDYTGLHKRLIIDAKTGTVVITEWEVREIRDDGGEGGPTSRTTFKWVVCGGGPL